jgi:hypothetical protein
LRRSLRRLRQQTRRGDRDPGSACHLHRGGHSHDDDADIGCKPCGARSERFGGGPLRRTGRIAAGGRRHPSRLPTPARDRVHPAESRQRTDACRTRRRRIHEPLPFRATFQAEHGHAPPSVRGPATNRPRPRVPCETGPSHRTYLADGRVPDRESLQHGVSPRHGGYAWRISKGILARRPARTRGRVR